MGESESPFAPATPAAGDAPVFVEAWHAQVLAVAHAATEAGLFTRGQWSAALGSALREHQDPQDHTGGDAGYYEAALAALETLIAAAGVSGGDLAARTEAWREAYLNTPHGEPVELERGLKGG